MNMNLPCVIESPGEIGLQRSGRVGAQGQEIRNAIRPLAMESYTQRVNTWQLQHKAKVRQTLTTQFLLIHPPPQISALKASSGPCGCSGKKKGGARVAI